MKRHLIYVLLLLLCALAAAAKGKKVLFIGDSVTDGAWGNGNVWNAPSEERDQQDMNHIYGHGFMMLCASHLEATYPMDGFVFWNRGISGNTLTDLHARWQKDVISLQPEVVSILIGTNDAEQCINGSLAFDIRAWEASYRNLLDTTLLALPDVRFVLCTPFVAETGRLKGTPTFAERQRIIAAMGDAVRRIAADYGAVLVPFDELFAELITQPSPSDTYWIWDGIHPTPAAHYRMAQMWMEKYDY